MFEVIYISPSCKQAIKFIQGLAVKLKQRGISGFDIDRKNLRIKVDKFIVSAVRINSSNLWRSYHDTKYYIGDASLAQYETHEQWRWAREILRELKSKFYQGTKQISEEELIEILTGVVSA